MTIKLYAAFVGSTPADVRMQKDIQCEMCSRLEHLRRTRLMPKTMFSILPWSMEELPGTSWRNAHTAGLVAIEWLGKNRWGKIGPDPSEYGGMFSIGLWRDDQFCIEHWVRVDHLPAEVQIEWAKERIAICRRELLEAQAKLRKAKDGAIGLSVTYASYEVAHRKANLEQARRELTSFCQQLGIELQENILNIGALPGEQLRMF